MAKFFYVCNSEIHNSFMENKMNDETQIENIPVSANRSKTHDPKSSQGQQTAGLQVSGNSWMKFTTLPNYSWENAFGLSVRSAL